MDMCSLNKEYSQNRISILFVFQWILNVCHFLNSNMTRSGEPCAASQIRKLVFEGQLRLCSLNDFKRILQRIKNLGVWSDLSVRSHGYLIALDVIV